MKKLLALATVVSFTISGAALANTPVKSEPVSPIAQSHQTVKAHHAKAKTEKKESKKKAAEAVKAN